MQFQQHARQFLAGHMEKRRVGEDAVEMPIRQIKFEKILLPHIAAAVGARHGGKVRGSFQADRDVAKFAKDFEVAPWPTAKIKHREMVATFDILQHCCNVLRDIVLARALPERFGPLIVMFQSSVCDFF